MAHQIQQIAYVGDTPWHQLGKQLPARQPIEVWAQQAGMDWSIAESPVRYMTEQAGSLGSIRTFDEQKVLYRSDTKAPLSVVSARYNVVQPKSILEFYRDLTEVWLRAGDRRRPQGRPHILGIGQNLDSARFGAGAALKQRALGHALQLAPDATPRRIEPRPCKGSGALCL